ncbi:MAG: hypothetical protein GY725_20890 [bacterium]|nr:hypothetical protein [bacterium]
MAALRASSGHLPDDVADQLLADPALAQETVELLLERHFPRSVHDDILAAVELQFESTTHVGERPSGTNKRRLRDPRFRESVLRAYEYRCAVTGFRAALSGSYFGCEAAHVQWHAYDGPDIVRNGIALEPTLHKLLDAGAWSLTDDRRVLVSAEFTGTDETTDRIRAHHGQPIRSPLVGESELASEFIRWHREPDLGGVFRSPSLPLP